MRKTAIPALVSVLASCGSQGASSAPAAAAASPSSSLSPATPTPPPPGAPAAAAGAPALHSKLRARLAPCTVPGVTEPLLCGSYSVWENRTTQQGRKIDLRIVAVPSLAGDPAPDPVFAFAGGPGDTVTNAARGWARERDIRAHRDIVLVDHRGTGGSHRLDCRLPRDPKDIQAYFEPPLPAAEVARCRTELEASSDLTQYTTSIAADDLDEVRGWLGYDKINLTGGSYGTRAAQVYLRRHGDRVRSAILIGVAAMDQPLPLFHARDGKRSLDLVIARCKQTPACAAAFPDLAGDLTRVLAGLDRARGKATVESPVDHRKVAVTIPRDIFAEQIRFTLYSASTAAATPYIIHRAAHGDFEPFARFAMLWEPSFRQVLAYGMHLSVTCAEDVPFIPDAAIEPAIAGTYLGGYRVRQQIAACKEWPRGAIPDGFHDPVTSDVPVLMISGQYDPVTPPRFAEQVYEHLSRAMHVVVAEGHHGAGGLSHEECIHQLQSRFFERGGIQDLDASYTLAMERPPFVTDAAGFAALVRGAN